MTFFTGRHFQPVKLFKRGCSKEEKLMILYRALRRTVIRKEKQQFMFVLKFLRSLTTRPGPSAKSQNQLRTHSQLRIYYGGLVQINRQKNALIGLMGHHGIGRRESDKDRRRALDHAFRTWSGRGVGDHFRKIVDEHTS